MPRRRHHTLARPPRRGGAVIIVVLSLLSLMIFLGVFFFEFAQEEQMAAENFRASTSQDAVDPEKLFDEALEQLTVGPDNSHTMSALRSSTPGTASANVGSVQSILGHILGRVYFTGAGATPSDAVPHNGHGIRTIPYDLNANGVVDPWSDTNGNGLFNAGEGDFVTFDLNADGAEDATLYPMDSTDYPIYASTPLMAINFSAPAQTNPNGDAFIQATPLPTFQPDVEYSYPDINNLFLAYDTTVAGRRILVPSFMRPDLLARYRRYDSTNTSIYPGSANLYRDANTARLVLRPHAQHRYPGGTFRFLSATQTNAQSGDTTRIIAPFPGLNATINRLDQDGDGNPNEMGPYSIVVDSMNSANNFVNTEYELDVDVDGDGQLDSIWIDLGESIVTMSDGRQFVPMFAYHVLDADSNINVNTAGNLQGLITNGAVYNNGTDLLSSSHTGASASEINPVRALVGDPSRLQSTSDLQVAQLQHAANANLSFSPTVVQAPLTIANMELYFLLAGRIQYRRSSSGSVVATAQLEGRYGDELYVSIPGAVPTTNPGYNGDDDNDNDPNAGNTLYEGGARRNTFSQYDPKSGYYTAPTAYGGHPIDPKGTGAGAYNSSGRVTSTAGTNGSPVIWPVYGSSGWEARNPSLSGGGTSLIESPYPNGATDALGNVDPVGGTLFPGTTALSMINEEDEINIANPNSQQDAIYGPEEALRLQLSSGDFGRIGFISRIEEMAPFNFRYATNASRIRKMFTPSSWDLTGHTFVSSRVNSGTRWEYQSNTSSANAFTSDTTNYFPPSFGSGMTAIDPYSAIDPFRPEVRTLLASSDTDGTAWNRVLQLLRVPNTGTMNHVLWKQPLNINRLLVGFASEDLNGNSALDAGEDSNNNNQLDALYPIYRQLMPHPDLRAAGVTLESIKTGNPNFDQMIHGNYDAIPAGMEITNIDGSNSSTCVTAMEWWARYDRQRLARDIYTLLYVLGSPQDLNPATGAIETPLTTAVPAEIAREMAQFAVNYVDALDRDNVITKFEYDPDLTDGWNVSNLSSPAPSRVFGVERTLLSFSEAQFVQIASGGSDNTTTLVKEERDVHQYLHIEIRNASPVSVPLDEGWRICRVQHADGGQSTGTIEARVEFKRKALADYKSVGPGDNFLISMHDGYVVNGSGTDVWSDLYADYDGSADLEAVLPHGGTAIVDNLANPDPLADLDLGRTGQPAPFDFENYYTIKGNPDGGNGTYDDNLGNKAADGNITLVKRIKSTGMGMNAPPEIASFDLVLERRQNLSDTSATASNSSTSDDVNEWIEVDRFHVNSKNMESGHPNPDKALLELASDDQTGVQDALTYLHSQERHQTFDPVQYNHSQAGVAVTGMALPHHSMSITAGQKHVGNSTSPNPFTLWEPHFDRDFTSAYELMSVPLYGNWPLRFMWSATRYTETGAGAVNQYIRDLHGGAQFNLAPNGSMSGDFTAGIRFKFPNGLPAKPYQGWNQFTYQNSWYRLFSLITVPRRADQQNTILGGVPGSMLPVSRTPGKINLNTLRDELILAAMIDDNTHISYATATNDLITTTPQRNWFLELLQSRDGVDAVATQGNLPGLPLPNSLSSHPFRGNAQWDPNWTSTLNDRSVEDGMLRSAVLRGASVASPTYLGLRPAGTAYTAPTLTAVTTFTSAGLYAGGTPPHDTSSMTWQGLFDAGDPSTTLDHHTRDRILNKIANNSTNKSHVYYVWIAVGYFEAHTVNGLPQIGARITDLPIHRKFVVLDMTKLGEAYDPNSNTFDYTKFIVTEKRLR